MLDIIDVIGKIKGWEGIPKRIQQIYFHRIQFKICHHEANADANPMLGMVGNGSRFPPRSITIQIS